MKIVHPRKGMIPAIKESAVSFYLIQKRPSGDPTPSQNKFEITQKLIKTRKIIGTNMMDHFFIRENSFFAFADAGLLSEY